MNSKTNNTGLIIPESRLAGLDFVLERRERAFRYDPSPNASLFKTGVKVNTEPAPAFNGRFDVIVNEIEGI